MVDDGARLEQAAPAGHPRPPGDVGVLEVDAEGRVEAADRVEHRAPVERGAAARAEDLGQSRVSASRCRRADEAVDGRPEPVDLDAGGVHRVLACGRRTASSPPRSRRRRRCGAVASIATTAGGSIVASSPIVRIHSPRATLQAGEQAAGVAAVLRERHDARPRAARSAIAAVARLSGDALSTTTISVSPSTPRERLHQRVQAGREQVLALIGEDHCGHDDGPLRLLGVQRGHCSDRSARVSADLSRDFTSPRGPRAASARTGAARRAARP